MEIAIDGYVIILGCKPCYDYGALTELGSKGAVLEQVFQGKVLTFDPYLRRRVYCAEERHSAVRGGDCYLGVCGVVDDPLSGLQLSVEELVEVFKVLYRPLVL